MNKIKSKYIFKDQYNPKYVNGAQGGISPQGEIIINFYLERNALPVSQTYQIESGKVATKEIESEPSDLNNSFVRVVENGVIMNYQTAKEIYKWLGNHIEKMEKLGELAKEKM
jgi:ssDNA-specific exonuclease RecJ